MKKVGEGMAAPKEYFSHSLRNFSLIRLLSDRDKLKCDLDL